MYVRVQRKIPLHHFAQQLSPHRGIQNVDLEDLSYQLPHVKITLFEVKMNGTQLYSTRE